MKKFSLILGLIVGCIFVGLSAKAASYYPTSENQCSPVDFRETFPLEMRNQHNVSWCFAHAAADYLQYAYQVPDQISAADVAISYSRTKVGKLMGMLRKVPAQTGFIKIAVKNIIPQGYCPESALPSEKWVRVDSENQESPVEIEQSILATLQLQKKVAKGSLQKADQLPWYFKFKNISKDQFFEILKSSTPKNVMLNIRNAACKNERKPFVGNIGSDFQIRTKNVFRNMNATFNQNMPVTIDFFSDVFRHFDHPSRKVGNLHTVLVYGRKYNTEAQECQYMIKDSYGKQCTKYDPKIECDGGYVWLPESKLFRAMTSQLILYQR